jgi:hypothetical protein
MGNQLYITDTDSRQQLHHLTAHIFPPLSSTPVLIPEQASKECNKLSVGNSLAS